MLRLTTGTLDVTTRGGLREHASAIATWERCNVRLAREGHTHARQRLLPMRPPHLLARARVPIKCLRSNSTCPEGRRCTEFVRRSLSRVRGAVAPYARRLGISLLEYSVSYLSSY
jgi:hypothetical protein